jgi:ankyrin repeat protein
MYLQAAKKILDCGGNINGRSGSLMYTPLHEAVMGGHVHMITFLLSRGADQRICDNNHWTALHLACYNNDISSARVLMRHESAPDALIVRDKHGKTPNRLCARRHIKEAVEGEY